MMTRERIVSDFTQHFCVDIGGIELQDVSLAGWTAMSGPAVGWTVPTAPARETNDDVARIEYCSELMEAIVTAAIEPGGEPHYLEIVKAYLSHHIILFVEGMRDPAERHAEVVARMPLAAIQAINFVGTAAGELWT